jgi:hypothetical protein
MCSALTENKIDDKVAFMKYHIKICLGDFNAKVGTEDIFKPIVRIESLHEISNDNGIKVVGFTT